MQTINFTTGQNRGIGTSCTVGPILLSGAFLSTVQMTQSTLYKILSHRTHSVGDGKINRSITLPMNAGEIIDDMARDAGKSVNQLLRELLVIGAKATNNSRALALKSAMHLPTIGCLLLTSWIYAQPFFKGFDDSVEMRRGRTVRIQRIRDQFNFEEVV